MLGAIINLLAAGFMGYMSYEEWAKGRSYWAGALASGLFATSGVIRVLVAAGVLP